MSQPIRLRQLVALGGFVLLAGGAFWALYAILDRSAGARNQHRYELHLTDAAGIKEGAEVRIAGVKVGSVDELSVRPPCSVVISFGIDQRIPIDQAARARIISKSLLGEKLLELVLPEQPTQPLAPGAVLTNIDPVYDINDMIHAMAAFFRNADGRELERFSRLMDTFSSLDSKTMQEVLAEANALLGRLDKTNAPALLVNVNRTMIEVQQLSRSARKFMDGNDSPLLKTLQNINGIMEQFSPADKEKLGKLIAQMGLLTESLNGQGEGELAQIVKEMRTLLHYLNERGQRYDALVEGLQKLTTKANTAIDNKEIEKMKNEILHLMRKEGIKVQLF